MSHVTRLRGNQEPKITPAQQKKILQEERWQYVHLGISKEVLNENFNFLNSAVVIRSGAVGIPLMTTTGIYGPIYQKERVRLVQGADNVVEKVPGGQGSGRSLLKELKHLKKTAKAPKDGRALLVDAKWVSGTEGGILPNVSPSANVFGVTGSLYINNPELDFPVVDHRDKDFDATLAYYGAKMLKKGESFYMGFDKAIFGLEYDTTLPGYIADYALQSWGGGGLFVETHPFPHIWFPNPQTPEEKASNVCRILLGRVIPAKASETALINKNENACADIAPNAVQPQYHFTVFRVPTDGHALAVDECTIHNDSFCNGKQVVFISDTHANTVALRETAPYKNLRISDWEKPAKK